MSDDTPTGAPRKAGPDDRAVSGPFDESEANPVRPYIDLGGIKILPREGLNLRLEVEEQTKRIVAVGLDYADSSLQVQPFAAPRTAGLWDETREQIRDQVRQQGGRVEEREGPLGPELLAEVPVAARPGRRARQAPRPFRGRRRSSLVPARASSAAPRRPMSPPPRRSRTCSARSSSCGAAPRCRRAT